MNENNYDPEKDYDSIKDVIEFQNNMFNPGHYIGTGKVPPTVSAPGNALPLAVAYFIGGAVVLGIGLLLFFGDITVTSCGVIKSPLANKIICLLIFVTISVFCEILGAAYLKKAKRYYRMKREAERERPDESVEDQLLQRICPACGRSHDVDYPKCPFCNHDYLH